MISSIALVSFLTTAAFAQTTSSFIPAGISAGCSTFLKALDADSSLTACLNPIISATAAYAPGSNAKPTMDSMTASLNTLCSSTASDACPDSMVHQKLSDFYKACTAEMTSAKNTQVISLYDMLYSVQPLKKAVCEKDDAGRYCVTETTAPSGSTAPGAQSPATLADTSSYAKTNLPFLFLTGDLPKDKLCTTCTKKIVNDYTSFELQTPYGPGMANSAMLGGQTDLVNGIQSTCGTNFLSGGPAAAAGGLGAGLMTGAASGKQLSLASVLAGLVAVRVAML